MLNTKYIINFLIDNYYVSSLIFEWKQKIVLTWHVLNDSKFMNKVLIRLLIHYSFTSVKNMKKKKIIYSSSTRYVTYLNFN